MVHGGKKVGRTHYRLLNIGAQYLAMGVPYFNVSQKNYENRKLSFIDSNDLANIKSAIYSVVRIQIKVMNK